MTIQELQTFFDNQLSVWHDCARRYADLDNAKSRIVNVDGRDYTLMYNPARIKSAAAKVANGQVDRPCFLCRDNRPAEQNDIVFKPEGSRFSYLISVNPFPIVPNHFTIINDGHCRQEMTAERLSDMASTARSLEGYLVFFNGANSGASAPDHFHFQAVPQHFVPLTEWSPTVKELLRVQHCEADDVKIDFNRSDFTNVLCWNTSEGLYWWVVNRLQHRPWQYDADGAEKVLISPASLEFAGVVPLAREEDFFKMNSDLLSDIYSQCWNREPLVDVGICPATTEPIHNADGTFTLKDVRIGIGFHWDQLCDFTYEGTLVNKLNLEDGKVWNINRLSVEQYLRSVISSEMSATSSLQLLKAHAVISRSWLIRQIIMKQDNKAEKTPEDNHIRWYDSHAHTSFDVCADDHCQRYQGIASNMNPVVVQAIEETKGEVLMYEGEVCDARFSKCCGGRTEEYKYCWDNLDVPYLQSVPDTRPDGSIFCNTKNKGILSQVLKDYDRHTRNFYNWEVEYSVEELSAIVEERLGLELGKIILLEPLERGLSGRISLLRITGENGSVVIGKELEIRKVLSKTHLYSSWFDISRKGDKFVLTGRGWGHGVGLCQIGAAVMGAEGYDYKEILMHYYKNVEIKKIW